MNNDFEVLPRGTIEELRNLREFVKQVDVACREKTFEDVRELSSKINLWYARHSEKYPL